MPGPIPAPDFGHMLNPAKGWPQQAALDFQAFISSNVLYPMVAGQVGHINSGGAIEPGVTGSQMGLFLFQGYYDLDVNNQSYAFSATSQQYWTPISPSGRVMCLPAIGPYELETTEFNQTLTYNCNDLLRAPIGNAALNYSDGTYSGQLTNAAVTLNTTACCGCVSRGVFVNAYGVQVLAFWPVYVPGTAGN